MCRQITPPSKPRSCRWMCDYAARLIADGYRAPLAITVNGRTDTYWVGRHPRGWEMLKEQPDGEAVQYVLDTTFGGTLARNGECNCPHARWRGRKGQCKHAAALAAALAKIGVAE